MHEAVAVVAGASGAIGSACASRLASAGFAVAGFAATRPEPEGVPWASWQQVDLRSVDEAREAVRRVREDVGPIGLVVHAVGDIAAPVPATEIDWERWRDTFDVCLGTAVNLVRATTGDLRATKGNVVFISSVASRHPYQGIADYCSAKSALESFAMSLAAELAPDGVRVNCVAPAVIASPLFDRSPYTESEAATWHALGRIGTPHEVAEAVAYLGTSSGSWVTGQTLVVDGGMLLP